MSPKRVSLSLWASMFIVMMVFALGMGGGRLLSLLQSEPGGDTSELRAGDPDRKTDRLAPEQGTEGNPAQATEGAAPERGPAGTPAGTPPVQDARPGIAAPPGAGAQFDALMERLAADRQRREERRRLASESPLTPGIEDAAGIVRRGRQGEAGAPLPSRGAGLSVPGATSPPGAGSLPGEAISTGTEQPATSLLARGSVIPAVLQTPLDSDLPGLVRAQVSEDVRDSARGRYVLIPRGAQLVGTYGSDARTGQKRLFIVWTDLRLPGSEDTLSLDRYGTLGGDGASGVRGRRATGLLAALGAAVLFDLAGNATAILTDGEASPDNESDLGALLAAATGNATSRVADRYLGDLLSRGPRFRVEAGARMNVLVEADMRLPVWEGMR